MPVQQKIKLPLPNGTVKYLNIKLKNDLTYHPYVQPYVQTATLIVKLTLCMWVETPDCCGRNEQNCYFLKKHFNIIKTKKTIIS